MTRTINRYIQVWIDNSAGALTQLTSINNIGGISLDSNPVELAAWADAIKGKLLDTPTFTTTIGGVFDSVDHALLIGIDGKNTPLAFDIRVGMGAAYSAGVDPQFGITQSATAGVLLHNYNVSPDGMTWTATIEIFAGSTAPGWGNANEA